MPPTERRMLVLLLALAVAGHGVRYWLTRPGQAPGGVQILGGLTPGSPLAHRDSSIEQARPLTSDERIDLDSAPATEIARLPRVGLKLAKSIQSDREQRGPFGGLEGLDRVPGVGPNLLAVLAPHVRFSRSGAGGATVSPNPAQPPTVLNLNSATVAELDNLPGIGPARARAIIRHREEHGPFTVLNQLTEVPGISKSLVQLLQGRLLVP
jgi:competence ComEA-like helix-hairpin-helix protein